MAAGLHCIKMSNDFIVSSLRTKEKRTENSFNTFAGFARGPGCEAQNHIKKGSGYHTDNKRKLTHLSTFPFYQKFAWSSRFAEDFSFLHTTLLKILP